MTNRNKRSINKKKKKKRYWYYSLVGTDSVVGTDIVIISNDKTLLLLFFLFYSIFFRWDDFPSIFHRECELLSSEEMFITLQILVFLIRSTQL